jgi:hypothetical protein
MNRVSRNKVPLDAIMYLIHHNFLLPKLPNQDDTDFEYETILLDTILDALWKFKHLLAKDWNHIIDSVIAMVTNIRTVSDPEGRVTETKLDNALRILFRQGKKMPFDVRALLTGHRWDNSASHTCSECRYHDNQERRLYQRRSVRTVPSLSAQA